MSSLKSKLRGHLMASHGARKNTRNNIWINYSHKVTKDITLASNNECLYWGAALEANPFVRSFKFGCELKAKYPWEGQFRRRDFILVEKTDNSLELHQLAANSCPSGLVEALILYEQNTIELETVQVISAKDVRMLAPMAMCWFQLFTFLNQIRNEVFAAQTDMVNLHIRSRVAGTVGALLDDLDHQDPMIVLGVFAREAVTGTLNIEFNDACFGKCTRWSLRSGQ